MTQSKNQLNPGLPSKVSAKSPKDPAKSANYQQSQQSTQQSQHSTQQSQHSNQQNPQCTSTVRTGPAKSYLPPKLNKAKLHLLLPFITTFLCRVHNPIDTTIVKTNKGSSPWSKIASKQQQKFNKNHPTHNTQHTAPCFGRVIIKNNTSSYGQPKKARSSGSHTIPSGTTLPANLQNQGLQELPATCKSKAFREPYNPKVNVINGTSWAFKARSPGNPTITG
jgi:hypothetical protein